MALGAALGLAGALALRSHRGSHAPVIAPDVGPPARGVTRVEAPVVPVAVVVDASVAAPDAGAVNAHAPHRRKPSRLPSVNGAPVLD